MVVRMASCLRRGRLWMRSRRSITLRLGSCCGVVHSSKPQRVDLVDLFHGLAEGQAQVPSRGCSNVRSTLIRSSALGRLREVGDSVTHHPGADDVANQGLYLPTPARTRPGLSCHAGPARLARAARLRRLRVRLRLARGP